MKLVTFTQSGATRIGVVDGENVVDLSAGGPGPPHRDVRLPGRRPGLPWQAHGRPLKRILPALALADVTLEAPILRPPKILAVGLNYRYHIEETGMKTPEIPMIFNKQSTSVIGPGAGIHIPRASDQVDYEGELGVVIGRYCRHVPKNRAAEVVAGYTIAHDVSVRDWQIRVPTFHHG